ncbi:hypothetical protein KM043_011530 [Ampulex compressa]|nr:hypothetical protein KM043_011530 [Ampulex compressa]
MLVGQEILLPCQRVTADNNVVQRQWPATVGGIRFANYSECTDARGRGGRTDGRALADLWLLSARCSYEEWGKFPSETRSAAKSMGCAAVDEIRPSPLIIPSTGPQRRMSGYEYSHSWERSSYCSRMDGL